MNPQVDVTGTTLSSSKAQFVTRKYGGIVKLSSGTFTVYSNTNGLPDGCKVLKVVAKNLEGRSLQVNVPYSSALMISDSRGGPSNPFTEIKKYVTAPLSRFPKITLQIPDLLAAPLDTGDTTAVLFELGSFNSTSTDTVELIYTVRYAL